MEALLGHNTDYYGLEYLIRSGRLLMFQGTKVIILGNGGVSGTVRQLMNDSGAAEIVTISRKGEDDYENISRDCDLMPNSL